MGVRNSSLHGAEEIHEPCFLSAASTSQFLGTTLRLPLQPEMVSVLPAVRGHWAHPGPLSWPLTLEWRESREEVGLPHPCTLAG